ncbi:hypothetical protein HYW67_03965 [Candidatus Parcubacteria bacterium]|nr:hypothetical protein [Candidatus Parcubacteria bacterium]
MKRSFRFGLFIGIAVLTALAAAFAPMAWAAGPEPPAPDICALIRAQMAQLEKASVLPERKSLWGFIFGLGVQRGNVSLGRAFEVTGWSRQENVLIEVEGSTTFLLGLAPSRFYPADGPPKVGGSGFIKFYEDSRSGLALYEPTDTERQRPYPIRQINVGLEGSTFYVDAAAFEANVTRPLVCAVFEAVRSGRVDRPVVVLAVESVGFCQDLSGAEPKICGLNISGRIVGISYRSEIPPPPPPSTPPGPPSCPPGGCG